MAQQPPPAKRRKLAGGDSHELVPSISDNAIALLETEKKLCAALKVLSYPDTVTHIYDPISYAVQTHTNFLTRFAQGSKKILFLGMNPGPFGMAQNGVPFGDTKMVCEFLGVTGDVEKPVEEHPNRPIHGLQCMKSEVSGTRFWGFFKDLCGSPEQFFKNCFVHNYCPLCYMTKTGKNVTPPMLKGELKASLQDLCDRALLEVIQLFCVEWVIGIGKYAADRAKAILKVNCVGKKATKKADGVEMFVLSQSKEGGDEKEQQQEVHVCSIMHPSPINPAANVNWAGEVKGQLETLGVLHFLTS